MTKELRNQIDGMMDSYLEEFLDAYQCQDWGINAQEFADYLADEFTKRVKEWALELDTPEEEEE